MFLGNFQHNLDDKGRLMIPARFREMLEGGAYITQGFDKCLMVMTEDYFKQVYERIEAMNLADPTARLLRRLILSNAYPVEVDKVGRILVPQNLRAFLGIENGELTFPVSEVTIASNLKDMFMRVTPANDIDRKYGVAAPTLAIEGMTLAGR